jgi:hypothetical protein
LIKGEKKKIHKWRRRIYKPSPIAPVSQKQAMKKGQHEWKMLIKEFHVGDEDVPWHHSNVSSAQIRK